ncbi:MAG TPA: Stk1 family PASTA domain-containing Ser/Thr kinase [Arachnia sp.]|nr:Stk1 family PASTA domain-containing Ser/Thr kinase [Arachnia sp.]HMT87535.1 Stk1 family PASTA domain-containing Ser/Thr kinase [Arachnia sp.]
MTEPGVLLGGRYELDQIIGRGGMAEVWRARDTRLNRDVAVKRLRVDLASDPTFQARFRREAQSAAGLNHPNIVSVYDTGEERDTKSDVMVPYIVMELVEGVTLRDVLRDGRKILPTRALEFASGVLDALAYSHRAGIIHRDIKPANVMLTPQGTAKVMDFGIARAVADTSATMTQTAAVIGTAQYLSPEQARGEKVDSRSDIYSVGCLLYELLVGEPPFKGDSPVSVAYQHVREAPVPPSQRDPEVTPAMDAITLKALAKDPRDRYQDATEFRDDIQACLNGKPVMAMERPGSADAATQVIDSGPLTTTVHRAALPTAVVPAPSSAVATPDEEEDDEAPRRRGVKTTLTVLSVLLVVALATALYLVFFNKPPTVEQVAVPNVVGFQEDAAVAAVEDQRLVATVEPRTDATIPEGQVIETDPGANTPVDVNSPVILYVSAGPEQVTVPDGLVNAAQADAERALTDLKLVPKIEEEASDTVAKGIVISANPASGTPVEPGATVTLKVSSGPDSVTVPDGLVGMTQAAAEQALKDANLLPKTEEEASDTVAQGIVISADPTSGKEVDSGSTVILKVSSGTSSVAVPAGLVGKSFEEASSILREANLTATRQDEASNTVPTGQVIRTTPESGASVEPNSSVTLVVSSGTGTVRVPQLVGSTVEQARSALEDVGFTSELKVNEVANTNEPAGLIFWQNRTADADVPPNTVIEVNVATG